MGYKEEAFPTVHKGGRAVTSALLGRCGTNRARILPILYPVDQTCPGAGSWHRARWIAARPFWLSSDRYIVRCPVEVLQKPKELECLVFRSTYAIVRTTRQIWAPRAVESDFTATFLLGSTQCQLV